jgi:hypothetical protein
MNFFRRTNGAPDVSFDIAFFTGAIFLSAALLFSVQPMFTKMVLPVLGGSPSVWSLAMVFFQTLLLAGYAYAHLLATRMGQRPAAIIHGLMLIAAYASLPIAARTGGEPPAGADPSLWLIGVFALSVGLPFFALSAQGPLLQAWFARSGHPRAKDPYFLYAASNIGSFAALLGYPLLIEPFFGLTDQSAGWSVAFLAMAALILRTSLTGDGAAAWRAPPRAETGEAIRAPVKAKWIALAFIPSALLVAVTAHMSTDIGSAPLIWVIPLGLFLLSFPLAFRARAKSSDDQMVCVQIWSGALVLISIAMGSRGANASLIMLAFHLVFFFASARLCHGVLYDLRPRGSQLTSFYLCMSLGGMIGGLFAGLAAPLIFSSLAEYPMLVAAAIACAPHALREFKQTPRREALAFGALFVAGAVAFAALTLLTPWSFQARILLILLIGLPMLANWRLRGRTLLLALLALVTILTLKAFTQGESYRSFFGVTRVEEAEKGALRLMVHGSTLHGAIRLRGADGRAVTGRPTPTTYYSLSGPMGETISAMRKAKGRLDHTAVVGLGAGTLACHFEPSERVTFYEIDPVIVRLATDKTRFRFLSDCDARPNIVLGDARLTLARQTEKSDLIVIDAFSSDAIPMHLLTREAVGVYLSKLAPGGALVMHISNNVVELADIVARIGAEHGLVTHVVQDRPIGKEDELAAASKVAVLARSKDDLKTLLDGGRNWTDVTPPASYPLWTDDRSTIFTALAAKWLR